MKYIIMCGGNYKDQFEIPKPLLKVNGEVLVERTIRLLRENGIKDIAISIGTNTVYFNYLDVELLKKDNNYIHDNPETNLKSNGCWLNAYYLMDEPCCYLHGDVYWSEEAIKTVIETEVKDTMFFCVADKSNGKKNDNIKGQEPLGYKVQNNKLFNKAVNDLKRMIDEGKFKKDPISWHLYRYINNVEMQYDGFGNNIFNTKGDYIAIDDYTTDIDMPKDIPKLEWLLKYMKGGIRMVKVKVIENFHLAKFNELRNLVRAGGNQADGYLGINDVFECTEEMAEYLTGKNALGRAFVEVIEVIPEKEEFKEEIKPIEKLKKTQEVKKTNTRKVTPKKQTIKKNVAKKK